MCLRARTNSTAMGWAGGHCGSYFTQNFSEYVTGLNNTSGGTSIVRPIWAVSGGAPAS